MSRKTILLQIHRDLLKGELNLPTLPEISLRIKKAASNPNADINSLSQVAEYDPAFCGYLLQISNSPMYRGSVDIDKLNLAISRLGLLNTCNIATSYAIRALFSNNKRSAGYWLQRIWKNSTYTASVAGVIAENIQQRFEPDEAILAGLLQDIGCLPLIDKASQYPELIKDEKAMLFLFNQYAANVGSVILNKWNLHDKFISVAKNRDNWNYDESQAVNLTDLTLVAKLHTYLGQKLLIPAPKINQIAAFRKLNIQAELSPESSLQFIADTKERIAKARAALGG